MEVKRLQTKRTRRFHRRKSPTYLPTYPPTSNLPTYFPSNLPVRSGSKILWMDLKSCTTSATMVDTIVCWYLQGEPHQNPNFLNGAAKWISQNIRSTRPVAEIFGQGTTESSESIFSEVTVPHAPWLRCFSGARGQPALGRLRGPGALQGCAEARSRGKPRSRGEPPAAGGVKQLEAPIYIYIYICMCFFWGGGSIFVVGGRGVSFFFVFFFGGGAKHEA